MGLMNMKYKMNKKGLAQMFIFLIVVGVIIVLFLGLGGISGFILKNAFQKIPTWFWVVGILLILFIITGGKNKK